jgi:hypothetical protein
MKLNKPTLDAIQRHLPLFLVPDGLGYIRLLAITQQFETGGERTRTLYEGTIPRILNICDAIFAQGGAINVDDIPWNRINIWRYGWTADLTPQRDRLQQLWRKSDYRYKQPQW